MTIYEHSLPIWLLVLLLIIAVVTGAYSYWRFAPKSIGTGLIAGLYLALLALLAWCILLPGKKTTETHTLKPRFVVAVDTSQSMNLSSEEGVANRWQRAQEALGLSWVKTISAECEIDVYVTHRHRFFHLR